MNCEVDHLASPPDKGTLYGSFAQFSVWSVACVARRDVQSLRRILRASELPLPPKLLMPPWGCKHLFKSLQEYSLQSIDLIEQQPSLLPCTRRPERGNDAGCHDSSRNSRNATARLLRLSLVEALGRPTLDVAWFVIAALLFHG